MLLHPPRAGISCHVYTRPRVSTPARASCHVYTHPRLHTPTTATCLVSTPARVSCRVYILASTHISCTHLRLLVNQPASTQPPPVPLDPGTRRHTKSGSIATCTKTSAGQRCGRLTSVKALRGQVMRLTTALDVHRRRHRGRFIRIPRRRSAVRGGYIVHLCPTRIYKGCNSLGQDV